jgi:hypothetical protein
LGHDVLFVQYEAIMPDQLRAVNRATRTQTVICGGGVDASAAFSTVDEAIPAVRGPAR